MTSFVISDEFKALLIAEMQRLEAIYSPVYPHRLYPFLVSHIPHAQVWSLLNEADRLSFMIKGLSKVQTGENRFKDEVHYVLAQP